VQPDHHLALGITPAASNAEVRAAYLRVMRASHPDLRPGDRHAGELARAANAAWEVLGDETRRGVYERLARIGPHGCRRQAEQPRRAEHRERSAALSRQLHNATVRAGAVLFALGLLLLLTVP
jgi:molecular chaperone DnaJ